MVLYLLALGVLLAVSCVLGLAFPGTRRLERPADRLLVGLWLGLVVLSVLLLAVTLFAPLRPAVVLSVVSVAVGACLATDAVRRALGGLRPILTLPALIGFGALVLVAVLDAAQRVPTGDVGLYHYQAIRWSAEFGAVPGLALLHTRLGPASAWFSLHAAFDWGPLEGRSEAIGGTLVVVLAATHLLVAVSRVLRRRASYADWFAIAALALLWPFLGDRLITSSYVETPLAVLAVVVGYLLIHSRQAARSDEAGAAGYGPQVDILPVLLAAGAVTWKLNAVPLLAVTFLCFAWWNRDRARGVLLGSVGVGAMLAPMVAYNVVTSGCPLYPVPACLHLPWAVDPSRNDYAAVVQDWNRWRGPTPGEAGVWSWLAPWFRGKPVEASLLLFTLAYGLATIVRTARRERGEGRAWTATLGLTGTAFIMYAAPNGRFLRIYLFIVPALLAGQLAQLAWDHLDRRGWLPLAHLSRRGRWRASVLPAIPIALALLVMQPFLNVRSALTGNLRSLVGTANVEWIRPIPIQEGARAKETGLRRERVNDLVYFQPEPCCRCWAAPLPCTPYLTHPDIRLRHPARGFGSGFRRTTEASARLSNSSTRGDRER